MAIAMLMMFVSPVSSSIPVTLATSPSGSWKPTPVFMTMVVLSTFTWSRGQGSR